MNRRTRRAIQRMWPLFSPDEGIQSAEWWAATRRINYYANQRAARCHKLACT